VQVIKLPPPPPEPEVSGGSASSGTSNSSDKEPPFLFLLEYLPAGTLQKVCRTAALRNPREPLSNQTLWAFFDFCKPLSNPCVCWNLVLRYELAVFEMAVALRYPSRYWPDYDQGPAGQIPKRERIPSDDEFRRFKFGVQGVDDRPTDYVHFDIEPSNSKPATGTQRCPT
jgi:hypothetical protein